MAEESYDERLQRHQELIEGLAKVWQRQGEMNDRLEAAMEASQGQMVTYVERLDSYMARMDSYLDRMEGYMRRQEGVNASVATTLADIKTLLARLLPPSGNGREA
jgi:hypothetical protein